MQLVGHAAVGIVLARAVGATNPVAAFGVGWASHYLADFFPHGDEQTGEWAKKGKGIWRFFLLFAVDGVMTLATFTWYVSQRGFAWWAAAAAVGSFMPDLMWGLEMSVGRKLFGVSEKLHSLNHNFFKIKVPSRIGIPAQLAVTAALWWWLTLR
jgi:hypothetical protein